MSRKSHQEPGHLSPGSHEFESLKLPPMLSPHKLAAILDLDRRRVYELIHAGELDAVRIGPRSMRVPRESFLRWLAAGGYGSRARQEEGE